MILDNTCFNSFSNVASCKSLQFDYSNSEKIFFFRKQLKQKQRMAKASPVFHHPIEYSPSCAGDRISAASKYKKPVKTRSYKKIPKARVLLYEQYFKEIELSTTPVTSSNASQGSRCRQTIARAQPCMSYFVPLSESSKALNEKSTKFRSKQIFKENDATRKRLKLEKEVAMVEKKLKRLKKKQAGTRKILRRSKKRLKKLFLEDHQLNLFYASLEKIENCIIYPL